MEALFAISTTETSVRRTVQQAVAQSTVWVSGEDGRLAPKRATLGLNFARLPLRSPQSLAASTVPGVMIMSATVRVIPLVVEAVRTAMRVIFRTSRPSMITAALIQTRILTATGIAFPHSIPVTFVVATIRLVRDALTPTGATMTPKPWLKMGRARTHLSISAAPANAFQSKIVLELAAVPRLLTRAAFAQVTIHRARAA